MNIKHKYNHHKTTQQHKKTKNMNKKWVIALLCAALGTSACGGFGCDQMGCAEALTIVLNNAEGVVAGTLTVNGEAYEIKTGSCESQRDACLIDGAVVLPTATYRVAPPDPYTVEIDVTATSNGVTRRAAQSVMIQETKYYPNGEDCPDECTNRRGSVTLQ